MFLQLAQNIVRNGGLSILRSPAILAPAYAFSKKTFGQKLQNRQGAKSQTAGNIFAKESVNLNIPKTTALHEVMTNRGINSFIKKVYLTSGSSIFGALAVSQMAINLNLPPGACFITSLIAVFGGIFGFSASRPEYFEEQKNGYTAIKAKSSLFRKLCYGSVFAGLGLSFAPLMQYAQFINPSIISTAMMITGFIFGSSSLFALLRKQDSLLTWGQSLYGSLTGLVILQIAGILSNLIIGPNAFSSLIFRADTFFGVGLFSAFIA